MTHLTESVIFNHMVEHTLQLNLIFGSLADPTRRDILRRVAKREYSIGELVEKYQVSFAAISKHLKVLEKARLITKRRDGQKQVVAIVPATLKTAEEYLEDYRLRWQSRHDKLADLLKN